MLEWIQESQSVLPLVGGLGTVAVMAVAFFIFKKLLKWVIVLVLVAIAGLLSLQYGEFDAANTFRKWLADGKEVVMELPTSDAATQILTPLVADGLPDALASGVEAVDEAVDDVLDEADEVVRDNLRDFDPGER